MKKCLIILLKGTSHSPENKEIHRTTTKKSLVFSQKTKENKSFEKYCNQEKVSKKSSVGICNLLIALYSVIEI